jgi:hypothetical protein
MARLSGRTRENFGGGCTARIILVFAGFALNGCGQVQKDLGVAGQNPGMMVCGGGGSISITGQAMAYGGTGSVMWSCGTGSYFGQGYPAQNLPLVPDMASMSHLPSMPPLGPGPPPRATPTP